MKIYLAQVAAENSDNGLRMGVTAALVVLIICFYGYLIAKKMWIQMVIGTFFLGLGILIAYSMR